MFFEPTTNTIFATLQDCEAAYPDAGAMETEEQRNAAGIFRLWEFVPAYDPLTHSLTTGGVQQDEQGRWCMQYVLTPHSPEHAAELAAQARMQQGSKITRLAFRSRFTMAEKATLEIASLDSPAAPMPERQQAAMLRAYLADVAASSYIDLQRADTRAGVQMLEQAGLIAAGRALQILDAPIDNIERLGG